MMRVRAVVDTNVFISYLLRPGSVPGLAVKKIFATTTTLRSVATWDELRIVVRRSKFTPYFRAGVIDAFLDFIEESSELVHIPSRIRACRDPRDDKFLEVAVHGGADMLITGDADLLEMHPFQRVAILTPANFLHR
jgi:putative PIN family toxin of toxin-antitoxin system